MESNNIGIHSILEQIWNIIDKILFKLNFVLEKYIERTQLKITEVIIITILCTLIIQFLNNIISNFFQHCNAKEIKKVVYDAIKSVPIVKYKISQEKLKLVKDLEKKKKEFLKDEKAIVELPSKGWSHKTILIHLKERIKRDVKISTETSKVSGTVYINGLEHEKLLNEVYEIFSMSNPLHTDVFPSVRLMEAEIIQMCAKLMGSTENSIRTSDICGSMTSGGTESILMAVKASRDYMKSKYGIRRPHMIIGQSAHAAFWKASEYFNIELTVVPVDQNYQLSPKSIKKHIKNDTILVVASAPGYPHGIMDPVIEIAKLTKMNDVLLHVDSCLGGFFLPFAKKISKDIAPYDFSVDGVTSMSMDTHKYGMSHKGTSVILFINKEIRKYQFTSITEWSGGMYISPGLPGSRSGGLIATAWASLMHLGEEELIKITGVILNAIYMFKNAISEKITDLEVIGDPLASVVAFKSRNKRVNIYQVNDLMSQKGWHLNVLQFPPALHLAFTARHINVVNSLIKDLKESVDKIKANPELNKKGGTAAIYGTASTIPDRSIVSEILCTYQDTMLDI